MKRMGFNLLITPEGVDPARYQALDFQDVDMPEEYVAKLAANPRMPAQHFVGKYQKTVQVNEAVAVLTGVLPEVARHGTMKTPMPTAYVVERGMVLMGSAAATAAATEAGDTITLLGKPFKVARVLDPVGAVPEDIRIYAHLHDVQELLGRPGRISAIDALSCQCPVGAKDIMAALERNVHAALPDVNVRAYDSILLARHKQRSMMRRLELAALAIVMAGAAAAIWGLTYQNVRSRRYEIGVLRALGVTEWRVGALFVGKIIAYSAVGALVGCVLGYLSAARFNFTESPVVAPWDVLIGVLLFTPLLASLFGLPPIVSRLLQEPVDVLGNGEA